MSLGVTRKSAQDLLEDLLARSVRTMSGQDLSDRIFWQDVCTESLKGSARDLLRGSSLQKARAAYLWEELHRIFELGRDSWQYVLLDPQDDHEYKNYLFKICREHPVQAQLKGNLSRSCATALDMFGSL